MSTFTEKRRKSDLVLDENSSTENIPPARVNAGFVPASSTNCTTTADTKLLENYDTCKSLLSLASDARTFRM
jgi:hypothetical protein